MGKQLTAREMGILGGRAASAKLTAAQRTRRAKKAAKARWAKKK